MKNKFSRMSHDICKGHILFKMENQNVAVYFDQLTNPINHSKLLNKNKNHSFFFFPSENSAKIKETKSNTILDSRKSYNLGL